MTSVQRFLANHNNLVRAAVLTAGSVLPSAAVRPLAVNRVGNGMVSLAGEYTGHADALIDVLIASGGATLRASEPAFAGVGNGDLAVTAIGGTAVVEGFTITLTDLGTETASARLTVDNVDLVAKTAGTPGNNIHITVTPDLTRTATDYSLLADWPAGQETLTGPEFDFGGLPLSAKGELDANSPRIQFGTDYQVYRPYRVWRDGAWEYGITPPPPRAIPAGTRAWGITGGYDVSVTDGTTTEAYADKVSFYDLLTALAGSALLTVEGVVTADRTPGGMAVRDVPLRTSAWVLSATGPALVNLVPATDAPTEEVVVECVNADAVGAETWTVLGSLSGSIGLATTGSPFASAVIGFVLPDLSDTVTGTGTFSTRFEPVSRAVGEGVPDVQIKGLTLGINARPGTYTWTYEERPENDHCSADDASIQGRVTNACLGLEGSDMPLDAAYKSRLLALYDWRAAVIGDTTVIGYSSSYSRAKQMLAETIVGIMSVPLKDLYANATALAAWDTLWSDILVDMETIDAPNRLTQVDIALPSATATVVNVGMTYANAANGNGYLVKKIVSSGEVVNSASVTLTVDATWPVTDAEFTKTSGATTVTFQRVEEDVDGAYYGSYGTDFRKTDDPGTIVSGLTAQYRARIDSIYINADIVPKSSASSTAGDGCWRDYPDASGWWVDQTGAYFPAFSNAWYISSKQSCGSGASAGIPSGEPYSTKEFAFAIAVGCTERLKVGDKVSITIGATDGAKPYRVGDKATIQVVTAGPAWLAGGVDGDDTQYWSITGSASGVLAPYAVPTDGAAIPAHTVAGVTIQLAAGGLPFALGDQFTVSIEAGQFRWRKDGGVWSALTDIDATVALGDGLSAVFTPVAAPSYLPGDTWTWRAEQPHAPAGLTVPTADAWRWSGTGATLTLALGGVETITALALARYSLPAGATVTIDGGDGTLWPESQAMTLTGSVSVAFLATAWSVSHLRVTVAAAAGGSIGWLWAGEPLGTDYSATSCVLSSAWSIIRGGGLNPASLYAGSGRSAQIGWSEVLSQTDVDALLAMLDDSLHNGYPLIFAPHDLHPGDARLVSVGQDALDVADYFNYQPDASANRMLSATLSLGAVLQ